MSPLERHVMLVVMLCLAAAYACVDFKFVVYFGYFLWSVASPDEDRRWRGATRELDIVGESGNDVFVYDAWQYDIGEEVVEGGTVGGGIGLA
ncbi:hypothetical protein Tco_0121689 [Tanacetum coccineum]